MRVLLLAPFVLHISPYTTTRTAITKPLALLIPHVPKRLHEISGGLTLARQPNVRFTKPISPQGPRGGRLLAQFETPPRPICRFAPRRHELAVIWQVLFENKIPRMLDPSHGHEPDPRYLRRALAEVHTHLRQRHALCLPVRQSPRKLQGELLA